MHTCALASCAATGHAREYKCANHAYMIYSRMDDRDQRDCHESSITATRVLTNPHLETAAHEACMPIDAVLIAMLLGSRCSSKPI